MMEKPIFVILLSMLVLIIVVSQGALAMVGYPSNLYEDEGDHSPVQISGSKATVGERFAVIESFIGIDVNCPSWSNSIGNLTLSLYKWLGNYADSVKETPIATKTFSNFNDNAWLYLEHSEQPKGEYLWVLSKPTETVGVWKYDKSKYDGVAYLNGREAKGDYASRVFYTRPMPRRLTKVDLGITSAGDYVHPYPEASQKSIVDSFSDTWSATDALGRKLPDNCEVGNFKEDKKVGLFYWTWNYNWADSVEPRNVSEITKRDPDAAADLDYPDWGPIGSPHWWSEPLYGYYRSTDPWVLRKHAEMLADVGVDALFFDCTNGSFTWKPSYMELCRVFAEARSQGVNTPQIAFMLAFSPTDDSVAALEELYNDLYKPGLYKDLWFYWKGKPMIMAYPDKLTRPTGNATKDKLHREMLEFFTFRPGQATYAGGPSRTDHWGWLEIYPQNGYAPYDNGKFEQATVGVAQNWSKERGLTAMNAPGAFGRSYTYGSGQDPRLDGYLYGLNFQEQWERALEIDPEFIFITGWNEWIAGRHDQWGGQVNAFPDEFDVEHSRDIEPMKGGFGDNYYLQMAANIRRFKGVRTVPSPSSPVSMAMNGDQDKWKDVKPEYIAHLGNTGSRDIDGWLGTHYSDFSGRNDIVSARVARDGEYVYFSVWTAASLTDKKGKAWMRLFIDVDRNRATGWEGYDFVVNRVSPGAKAVLERSTANWAWTHVADVDYAVKGDMLELKIPRAALGLSGSTLDFDFKWVDNTQHDGDIMDFYVSGDSAPLGRFNFRYKE